MGYLDLRLRRKVVDTFVGLRRPRSANGFGRTGDDQRGGGEMGREAGNGPTGVGLPHFPRCRRGSGGGVSRWFGGCGMRVLWAEVAPGGLASAGPPCHLVAVRRESWYPLPSVELGPGVGWAFCGEPELVYLGALEDAGSASRGQPSLSWRSSDLRPGQ